MKSFLMKSLLVVGIVIALFTLSITVLNDRTSQWLRHNTEQALNGYLHRMALRADQDTLTTLDRFVVHGFTLCGAAVGCPMYPEAAKALIYCIYGNGKPVEVSASYFKKSPFIKQEIERLGTGHFKEIGMHQADDWRTSLAFNPYNLHITRDSVELYYPATHFKSSPRIVTKSSFW